MEKAYWNAAVGMVFGVGIMFAIQSAGLIPLPVDFHDSLVYLLTPREGLISVLMLIVGMRVVLELIN